MRVSCRIQQLASRKIEHTTTNANTHQHTPENDHTDDGDGRRVGSESLSESCEDDQDELETIHPLAADHIGQPAEAKLTDDSSTGRSDLDSSVGGLGDGAALLGSVPVDRAKHVRHHTNGEDVVGVGEETNASDEDGADVVPAERSLVNLGQSETTTLVGVGDVGIVVVEVVEGSIASRSPGRHVYR